MYNDRTVHAALLEGEQRDRHNGSDKGGKKLLIDMTSSGPIGDSGFLRQEAHLCLIFKVEPNGKLEVKLDRGTLELAPDHVV